MALFPLFEKVQLFMDQLLLRAVVLWEHLEHLDVEPLYVKVPLMETDHITEPAAFL